MVCTAAAPVLVQGNQNLLKNGSMESGPGGGGIDAFVPAEWTLFGSVSERSAEANIEPPGAGHALKAFASQPQEGAYQEVPVVSGNSVSGSAWLFTHNFDKLSGDAMAGIVLEFYNAGGNLVGSSDVDFVLTAASPADTWIPAVVGPLTAPGTAVKARLTCVWIWGGSASGASFWDDTELTVNSGANLLLNADFEEAGPGKGGDPLAIDHWTGFNDQDKSSDTSFHGDFSVRVGMNSPFSGSVQNLENLSEGERVLLKARVMNLSSDPLVADARAGIKLEFFLPTGTTLPPPEENLEFNETSPQDSWELVEIGTDGLEVPEGISLARIVMLYFGDANSSGAVYFDSASAELSSAPGTNQLLNASFEDGDGGANGITSWTEFNSASATAQKAIGVFEGIAPHDGSNVMKATGDAIAGIRQDIPVTAGETLDVSARLLICSACPAGTLMGTAVAGVKVEWVAGTVPPQVDITAGPSNNTIVSSSPQDQWIDLFIDYTMPAGSFARGQFTNLVARGSAATGAAYFDACEAVVLNRFDGADLDNDDDEDLFDFAGLQNCYSGAGVTPLLYNCIVFDEDEDEDVDAVDFQYFQPRMTGPTGP
jgi:hypothetical protein